MVKGCFFGERWERWRHQRAKKWERQVHETLPEQELVRGGIVRWQTWSSVVFFFSVGDFARL